MHSFAVHYVLLIVQLKITALHCRPLTRIQQETAPNGVGRNMSTVNHDCNGTRHVVKQILPKTLVLTRLSDGGTFYCFRIKLAPSDCRTLPVRFTRLQYPGAPRHPTT